MGRRKKLRKATSLWAKSWRWDTPVIALILYRFKERSSFHVGTYEGAIIFSIKYIVVLSLYPL